VEIWIHIIYKKDRNRAWIYYLSKTHRRLIIQPNN
jgi:hypothetical protein